MGQEYGALHRRYGNVQQLRQALASNSTLAASHSLLASLLRASTAAGGPNASAGSSAWPFASRGADASGGPSDDAAGMLAAGPQPITDDHVQSALRLAMSNLAAPDEDDPEEEGGQGADANADGSKEMHFADAHAQDDVERHEATGTLPVAADAAPDDLPVLLDSAALDVTGLSLSLSLSLSVNVGVGVGVGALWVCGCGCGCGCVAVGMSFLPLSLCLRAAKRRQSKKIFDHVPQLDLNPNPKP